jgi:isocitrate dehydrogenase kinase/phosphatase
VIFRKRPFADVIARQLDVFAEDQAHDVFAEIRDRKDLYDRADRDEAEELYGDYIDAVETGTEALADMRDRFKRTLADEDAAEEYEREFNRAVKKRWSMFGLEIELR